MSRQGGAHDSNPRETDGESRPRVDPTYSRVLLPAVMATAMSLVMSLVDTNPSNEATRRYKRPASVPSR